VVFRRAVPLITPVPGGLAVPSVDLVTTTRLRMSVSAVEKHVASILGKLQIDGSGGYSRRVLAILRHLG
jgi:hypothetical protein